MTFVVRPELPTASVGSSQAPTAAVDNFAPFATARNPLKNGAQLFKQPGPLLSRPEPAGNAQWPGDEQGGFVVRELMFAEQVHFTPRSRRGARRPFPKKGTHSVGVTRQYRGVQFRTIPECGSGQARLPMSVFACRMEAPWPKQSPDRSAQRHGWYSVVPQNCTLFLKIYARRVEIGES